MRVWIFCCISASGLVSAQTFDAASVKVSTAQAPFSRSIGGPGTKDPGRIRYSNIPLKSMVLSACGVRDYQVIGPAWLDSQRFDVDASLPPSTSREQFRVMLLALLQERFQLQFHRESKDGPGWALLVANGGPKLTESMPARPGSDTAEAAPFPPGPPKMDNEGFPVIPSGGGPAMMQLVVPRRARVIARQQTMSDLAGRLEDLLGRPVSDATALTGKYDFVLTFATEGTSLSGAPAMAPPPGMAPPPPGASEAEPAPEIPAALRLQLGLKLESRRGRVDTIVIDRIEKVPTGN